MATANTTKTFITINGEERQLTNALALELAIQHLAATEDDTLVAVAKKLEQHRATITKKSAAPVSKAALENAAYASRIKELAAGEFTLEWVATQLRLVATDGKPNCSKAYQVVKVLLDAQEAVKVATKASEVARYRLV